MVALDIRDNGLGFDSSARQSGVGLVGMRERCTAVGGVFGIVSRPGSGTTISVSVPLASWLDREEAA
jgi:signal transduction histidine kinase